MADTTVQVLAAMRDDALRQRLTAAAITAHVPDPTYWVEKNIGRLVTAPFPVGGSTRTLTTMWSVAVREELVGWLKGLGVKAGVTIAPGGDIEYYTAQVGLDQVAKAETPEALTALYTLASSGETPGWSARITDTHLTAAVQAVAAG